VSIDVEVLIVSYGSADDVTQCLASIEAFAPGARVAIREHHPEADAYARLVAVAKASGLDVRTEHDPANRGFGAGCNALARISSAEWLLFLNPDAELVTWPWSVAPQTAPTIIGPMFTEDATDHFGVSYRVRDEVARSWLRRRGQMPTGAGFVSGAALLVDAETFHRLGGFDERYFLFYEDIDLCLRANAIGVPTVVEERWQVAHRRGHSTKERFGQSLIWSYESGCRFHREHGSSLLAYRAYVVADALARAVVHTIRRNPAAAADYVALAGQVTRDVVSRRTSRPWP
jgi:N-acetylglucosaminyl-diphospho-decaprenol L-rhamnosyltransferase